MQKVADVFAVERPARIDVPDLIAEETGIQGFVFSRKLLPMGELERYANPKTAEDRQVAIRAALAARRIAEEMDGGPGLGENYIEITISNADPNAGSNTDFIYLYFGGEETFLRLHGPGSASGECFPKGKRITWDMNPSSTRPENWIEHVPTDAWDNLLLVNPSGDGILIDHIKVVHSSFTIVDWPLPGKSLWLDGSPGEKYTTLGLAYQILQKKLEAIPENLRWIPQLYWAALELGKTDGKKYGTTGKWCSEFASWCLRKAGWWEAPDPSDSDGDIGVIDMANYFASKDRLFSKQNLLEGKYTLMEGDYLRFEEHSALFVRYESDGRALTDPAKRFISIDGNNKARVRIASGEEREIRDLVSVGCTR
jgi:hypothetical protein